MRNEALQSVMERYGSVAHRYGMSPNVSEHCGMLRNAKPVSKNRDITQNTSTHGRHDGPPNHHLQFLLSFMVFNVVFNVFNEA